MLCSPHNGPFMGQTADFMTCCPSLKRIGRCAAVLPQGGEGDGTGAVIRNREILNAHQRMNAGFITSNAADCLNLRHAAPYSMAGNCSMQGWREDASRIGCPWAAFRFPLRDRIGTADAPQVVGRCRRVGFDGSESPFRVQRNPDPRTLSGSSKATRPGSTRAAEFACVGHGSQPYNSVKDWECPGRHKGSGDSGALLFWNYILNLKFPAA